MNKVDIYYKENLRKILNEGHWDKNPRPKYKDGTPAHSKYITQVVEKYNLSKGEFPITTLRNTAIKTGIKEIIWIYQLQSNKLEDAHKLGINWWDNWDIGDGTIGERYAFTVKRYNLIYNILNGLKQDPFSRRHVMNLYQYENLYNTDGLYPCAFETIFNVREVDNKMYVDMTLHQRSNDYITAGYINKVQYIALLMMICGHLGYEVGNFMHIVENLHIYDRHFNAANEILERDPLDKQPIIKLTSNKSFYEYTINDFIIENIDGIEKIKSNLEIAI